MKYKPIIGLMLVFWGFHLPQSMAQIGIQVGFGISDIGFKNQGQSPYLTHEVNSLEHRLPVVTFQAGAVTTFRLGNRFGFQGELNFAMRGLDYSSEFLFDDITYKMNISYLQLPVLLRYHTSQKTKGRSGFLAGPYLSRKLKAVLVTEIEGQKRKAEVSNVKDFDFGIVGGYFMEIGLTRGDLLIDVRSSFSLNNMMNYVDGYIPKYYGPSKEYARNINISLSIGYRFTNLW